MCGGCRVVGGEFLYIGTFLVENSLGRGCRGKGFKETFLFMFFGIV